MMRSHHVRTHLRHGGLSLALFVALMAAWPESAHADVRTEARRHFRRGMELVGQGQVDEGVAELQEAYDILPHPNVLYNIGRAYAEAGRYEDAIDYFEEYLDSDPPDRAEVEGFVQALQARVAAASGGTETAGSETTETTETTPPDETVEASDAELAAIEAGAARMRELADADPERGEVYRERAERLDSVARALRAQRAAAEAGTEVDCSEGSEAFGTEACPGTGETTVATTTTETGDPGTGTAPGEGISLGGEADRGDAELYEETVVSASRTAQNPLDAPNATTNITAQDIRLTGHTALGELLRRVPGAQVMTLGPADIQVGFRGFNQRLANRVLMLVNGRSVYIDPLGNNFYATQAFAVEDIERIEVIRGPASALYGADAFSGIINIITRDPATMPDTRRTTVTLGGGSDAWVHMHMSTMGREGELSWRIAAGYDQANNYTLPFEPGSPGLQFPFSSPEIGVRHTFANASLAYRIDEGSSVRVEAGIFDATQSFLGSGSLRDFYSDGPTSHVMASYEHSDVSVRAFWNRLKANAGQPGATSLRNTFLWNTYDVEADYHPTFEAAGEHQLHIGASYRRKEIDWDFIGPEGRTENHYAGFLQDTWIFSDRARLIASFRLDNHPLVGFQPSPRIAFIGRPTEDSAIRASFGRAFRTQTFLESYVNINAPSPLPSVTVPTLGSEVAREQLGTPAIDPETILSAELGYRWAGSDFFDFELATYFNVINDLVLLSDITPFTLGEYGNLNPNVSATDPDTGAFLAGQTRLINEPTEYQVLGGELSTRVYPVDGLDIYANVSVTRAVRILSTTRDNREDIAPRYQANLGLQYRSRFGLDFSGDYHLIGKQNWFELTFSGAGVANAILPVETQHILNARIGYRLLDDSLSLGIVGTNLLNQRIAQHPFGQPIGARVLGTAAYQF